MSGAFVRLAFNIRVRQLFDYRLPEGLAAQDAVGRRALAPFGEAAKNTLEFEFRDVKGEPLPPLGQNESVGIVMDAVEQPEAPLATIKQIKLLDDMPPLPPATLDLIRFCAEYTHSPIGAVAACALPAFFRRRNVAQPPMCYRRSAADHAAADVAALSAEARAIYDVLGAEAMCAADLRRHFPAPAAALKKLLAQNLIEKCRLWHAPATAAAPAAGAAADAAPQLRPQQQEALAALELSSRFAPHLLFGATGSGKTEIYLRAVEKTLAAGRQALVLTPEIHLTPQLEGAFARRFPAHRIVTLHSGLSDGERARRWLMAGSGAARIVLGTRLAVFTPLPQAGLIVVDEEHDDSFKQEEGVMFSARNLAVWRAKREGLPFIAGSATPALESLRLAQRGDWKLIRLQGRVHSRPPAVQIVPQTDNDYHGMDSAFVSEFSRHLDAGGQGLIFINRRGYAPALLCRQCGGACGCKHCTANMTVHRRRHLLLCHLCGASAPLPAACPSCGGPFAASGSGTQRIEEAAARRFPRVRIARLDRDSLAASEGMTAAMQDMQSGKTQLLIGTQLLAKGHNFPHLSLIGILNADAGLAAADLRAEERLFALLSQVIGRGTRNPSGCRVLVQTRHPQHPFYRDLAADDVEACWRRLLAQRDAARMPPFAHLALLRGKDKNRDKLENFMQDAVRRARLMAPDGLRVFDSVAPAVEIVGDWHRRQTLLHAQRRAPLHDFLRRFLPALPASVHWTIDVDPLSI